MSVTMTCADLLMSGVLSAASEDACVSEQTEWPCRKSLQSGRLESDSQLRCLMALGPHAVPFVTTIKRG